MRKKRTSKKNIPMTIPAFAKQKYVVAVAAVLAAAVLAVIALVLYVGVPAAGPVPTTFSECAALYPVKGTMPRTCTVPFGKTFVEYDGNANAVGDEVQVNLPPAAVLTQSPATFTGAAKSDWFNAQGALDIKLVAGTGAVIATVQTQAAPAGTPAPEGYKAFSAQVSFPSQTPGSPGALVITKSGSTQSLVIPVAF